MQKSFYRYIATVACLCTIWFGSTWPGFADIRIVEQFEGGRTETLFKGNRMASQIDVGTKTIFLCESGQMTVMSTDQGGRYWQGNITAYKEELTELLSASSDLIDGLGDLEDMGDFGDFGEIGAFFEELFGGGKEAAQIQVRVTEAGVDNIAGYAAEHYIVETNSGNEWKVYEEIWISRDLFKEIAAEAPACPDLMVELMSDFSSGIGSFGLAEMDAVLASPDYRALMERGYPVRSKQSIPGLFGETMELLNEVVEVTKDTIAEDAFTVPAGHRQVGSFFEVIDM